MKILLRACPIAAIILLACSIVRAQTSTSPQGTAAINTAAVCASSSSTSSSNLQPCTDTNNNGQWFTVMNASLKTSNTTDLFISPSLVTGLFTNTQVKGSNSTTKNPDSETATAVGSIAVRVLLDCTNCATPGSAQSTNAIFTTGGQPDPNGHGIVYDAKIQQLTATLGQAVNSFCLTQGISTCPQEVIDLILSTTSAHTFNYIMLNVGSGQHTITVQARLDTGSICYGENGAGAACDSTDVVNTSLATSVSTALFGLGSVTVIPVHLAPGFSF